MVYLVIAYAVFWGITFALVFSIFVRQNAAERELNSIKLIIEREMNNKVDQGQE